MEQVLRSIESEPENTVEIIVHVAENLADGQRSDLVAALEKQDGIISAEFCPLRYHLMLVRYDRDMRTSQDMLASVRSQNIHAKLIGPI
jgi:CII-binding regulator of phage lambda lysogenization HflD